MKILKKIIILLIIFSQIIILNNTVKATNINEIKSLERGERGYYCVQKWDGNKWIYLTYNKTYYTDTNGEKKIAYCLSPGLPGVGYVSGEKETYNVKITDLLKNESVWRIIKNGYPSKTPQELGLETTDDAYFATMQAINCVLRGYTLEEAKTLYSPGQFSINGESYDDIQRRGTKTLKVMYDLIHIGLNGTQTSINIKQFKIQETSDFVKEKDTYSKTFKVISNGEIQEYEVTEISGFPSGTIITDLKGNPKKTFNSTELFKINIPIDKIKDDISAKIIVNANQKNYQVYYGKSMEEGFQDYALCDDLYAQVKADIEVFLKTNKSKLIITKVDAQTKQPIEGVKYEIKNIEGKLDYYFTNEKGQIILSNIKPGEVIIKEIETVGKYKINEEDVKVKINFNETKEIQLENELKKGNIKIIKSDYDDQKIKLEKIKFQLINEKGDVIEEKYTNDKGEINFDNIVIGKYYIKEIECDDRYVILNEDIEVEVKYNETLNLEVKNELKKSNIKILKIDSDDENIKLDNVEFSLLNEKDEIVMTGKTNEKGELVFDSLPIGKYKIVETACKEGYIINEEEYSIDLVYGEDYEIIIENEKEVIPEPEPEPEPELEPEPEPEHEEKVEELPKTGNRSLINLINMLSILILSIYIIIKKIR